MTPVETGYTEDKKKHTKDVEEPAKGPKTLREALLEDRKKREADGKGAISVEAHLPTDIDTPFKEPEEDKRTPDQKKAAEELQKKKDEVVKKIGDILKKYDNRESLVPASSEYWTLVAELRGLNNP